MSGSQKALKVISIVLIIWAIITILIGAFLAAGSAMPGMSDQSIDVSGTALSASSAALALGVGTVVGGVINFIIGFLGLRGAKNPKKIGAFLVLCIIGLVLGIVGIVLNVMNGAFQWTDLVSVVIVAVCTILAFSVRKQA